MFRLGPYNLNLSFVTNPPPFEAHISKLPKFKTSEKSLKSNLLFKSVSTRRRRGVASVSSAYIKLYSIPSHEISTSRKNNHMQQPHIQIYTTTVSLTLVL